MKLDAFSEQLLQLIQEEYRMSHFAVDRFRRLARNGLSIEQLLLASGLVNTAQYHALLEIASGLPVCKTKVKPLSLDYFPEESIQRWQAIPFKNHRGHVQVAFALPTPQNILTVRELFGKAGFEVIPFVIPEAWFKRSLRGRRKGNARVMIEQLLSTLEVYGLTHIRLVEDGAMVHIMTDAYHPLPDIFFLAEELPALMLYLKRKQAQLGWSIMEEHRGLSSAYQLRRDAPGAHPLDWVLRGDKVLQHDGMTILIQSDPQLNTSLQAVPSFNHVSEWKNDRRKYIVRTPEELELALHAALAGEPVIAICQDGDVWWSDLSRAGIPVKVLKSSITPQGRAWEVYSQ